MKSLPRNTLLKIIQNVPTDKPYVGADARYIPMAVPDNILTSAVNVCKKNQQQMSTF